MPNCRKICIKARPNDSGRDKARNAKEMMSKSLLTVIEKIQKVSPVFEDHDAPKAVPALEAPKFELPAEWNRNREVSPETLAKLADFGGFDE